MRIRTNIFIASAILVACVLAVSACGRGPNQETLQVDLQARLEKNFEAGLFEIVRLRRMGSAPIGAQGEHAAGLLVYFDAELRFERDYSLTGWKGLNLGTLAFVLGATESGISGFRAKGNQTGDILLVHGRLKYSNSDDDWQLARDVVAPPTEPAAAMREVRGAGPDAVMRSVYQLLEQSPKTAANSKEAVIVREMRRAASRIDLQIARLNGKLTFGTGPELGTYHSFGLALSNFADSTDVAIHSYSSEGSLENGMLIQQRALDVALVQSDVAELLFKGQPAEGIFPNRDLRSVASLWPEAVHLITLKGTGIRQLQDLRGRRIAIGYRGSGTRFNAIQISLAAGIDAGEMPEIREAGLLDGLRALEQGEIEALFATTAIPSPALQDFAERRPDVRLVPIDGEVVDTLTDKQFAYYPMTVAARTYPGQEESFSTVGLSCALIATRHTSAEAIEQVLSLLVDGTDQLSERYFRAAFVSPDTMRLSLAVPLHHGAERFYEARESAALQEAVEASRTMSPED